MSLIVLSNLFTISISQIAFDSRWEIDVDSGTLPANLRGLATLLLLADGGERAVAHLFIGLTTNKGVNHCGTILRGGQMDLARSFTENIAPRPPNSCQQVTPLSWQPWKAWQVVFNNQSPRLSCSAHRASFLSSLWEQGVGASFLPIQAVCTATHMEGESEVSSLGLSIIHCLFLPWGLGGQP